jgi:hypothetical protein
MRTTKVSGVLENIAERTSTFTQFGFVFSALCAYDISQQAKKKVYDLFGVLYEDFSDALSHEYHRLKKA